MERYTKTNTPADEGARAARADAREADSYEVPEVRGGAAVVVARDRNAKGAEVSARRAASPIEAHAAHAIAIGELVERIRAARGDCADSNWSKVGSLRAAEERLVSALYDLSGISEDEARDVYGVEL